MPKRSFSIEDFSVGSIQIEPQTIYGKGGPVYPHLGIPLTIEIKHKDELHTDDKGKQIKYIRHYSLIYLFGEMYITHGGAQTIIAHFHSKPLLHTSDKLWEARYTIEIPLDMHIIEYIEDVRQKNVHFRIHFEPLIAKHTSIPYDEKEKETLIQGLLTGDFDFNLEIPHSHWIDSILTGLGYGKFKLIEIPIPEKLVPDIFQKALMELQESQNYFVKGDYDEVIAHCRNAIQLIPETCKVDLSGIEKPTFNDKIKGFLTQHLPAPFLTNSKRDGFVTITKALWTLTAIPHHPSPPRYFNRTDAEMVMLVTTALVAYIGKLLKKKEE